MSKFDPNSNEIRTAIHIVHAHDHAKAGMIPEAETHLGHAEGYRDAHIADMKGQGKHDVAHEFHEAIAPYFAKVKQIIEHAKKSSTFISKLKKPKKLFKSHPIIEALEKGLVPPEMALPVNFRRLDSTKSPGNVKVDRQPGKDPRYDYKSFSDLSHDDQIRASHAFQGKDMHNHHYPVDKGSGEFVHGATRWLQANKAPQATPSDQGTWIAPQHRAGAAIRIHSEDHPLHGKLGVVKAPNPNMPGKIPVQVGPQSHQVEYLEPHQVKLSSGQSRDVSMANLVDRSKAVLKSIRGEDQ